MIEETHLNRLRLVEMSDGKVNFLSLPMRVALLEALERAQGDGAVETVVLAGRGACFCAGMNIEDFEAGKALLAPSLHSEILEFLAGMTKPVVAAIHGGAHGGGLELALGCHYRLGLRGAKVSLPEVLVGMMPGAGGTQHLPRAIGLGPAADMILNGRRVAVEDAPAGLIDQVVDGDLLDGAAGFARSVAGARPLPRLRDVVLAGTDEDLGRHLPADGPEYPGAVPAIRALKGGADVPYAEGMAREFADFLALKDCEDSRRFRAAFLAKLKADARARRQGKAAAGA